MRREKCMLLGGAMLLFWAGIYYVSYVSMPPDVGKGERLKDKSRYAVSHHTLFQPKILSPRSILSNICRSL